MSNFIINGGRKLSGEIKTNSAKNSALAILCATVMIRGETILDDVPRIEEVYRIVESLESIGMKIRWSGKNRLAIENPGKLNPAKIARESFSMTRSGLMLAGGLAHSVKNFRLPRQSGCKLGKRTVNPHIIALERLGIKIKEKENHYEIATSKIKGAEFTMYEMGDTATENVIIAAALAAGKTTIHFAASNYMVQDLCFFLNSAGAKIEGVGSAILRIEGARELKPTTYPIMPDPIESMAFVCAAIATGSKLKITDCPIDFLGIELEKLRVMGQKFKLSKPRKSKNGRFDLIDIEIMPSKLIAPPDKIHPQPYPGLNIDNLPFFVPILTQAKGKTLVHDWVYENRAIYYTELNKLGADITLYDPHRVSVVGPTEFKPAEIICPPALRPAILLLIAMLAAKGKSLLRNSYSIDRGYEDICGRLNRIGADIKKTESR